jgi:hypothetical protein
MIKVACHGSADGQPAAMMNGMESRDETKHARIRSPVIGGRRAKAERASQGHTSQNGSPLVLMPP